MIMANDKARKKIKIETPKGRPMLNWVGKKPLDYVQGYPVQMVEVYNLEKETEQPILLLLSLEFANHNC